ncbi:MAG TPA: trypsin-like peptidase domain-containing protein [Planctomycetota bacterium]|nr:trypsin-like peptidase domain-containing protein [Planctomycetota bacterium]
MSSQDPNKDSRGFAQRWPFGLVWGLLAGVVLGVVISAWMARHQPAQQFTADTHAAQVATETPSTAPKSKTSEFSAAFRAASKTIAPSVVHITTKELALRVGRYRSVVDYWKSGSGSGFIIDGKQGVILTNNHVIVDADRLEVKLADGRQFQAKRLATDPQTDLALIQLQDPPADLVAAQFGDSDQVEVGDWVLAVGNPFGSLENSITAGIISAKGRNSVGLTNYDDFMQTDAAINPGNSGGPLIDLDGTVIGINTAIFSDSGGYQGVGLSIPINQAKSIVDELLKNGKVTRGWLGVEVAEVLKGATPIQVQVMWKNGPADRAGLRIYDYLKAVDGVEVKNQNALKRQIAAFKPGATIKVVYVRNKTEAEAELTVMEQPPDLYKN